MFKSKLLWRMSVIILVVAFSAATIVSCGGDTPTQSTSLSTSSVGGTGTGGNTGGGTTTKPTFPKDTYYKIYAPWVKWDESQAPNRLENEC